MKTITGISRLILKLRIIMGVFFTFIPLLFSGKISIKRYIRFSQRLLFFLDLMKTNKFIKFGNMTKIELYMPGFPSRAFYESCKKFLSFEGKMPAVTVLISITSACRFKCQHCYQRLDKGQDVEVEVLIKVIKELQNMGITFFNIEGGDPFLTYERLKRVCAAIDDRSEIWINSTGDGITLERLKELKSISPLTSIMFSLRASTEEKFNELMGVENAWAIAAKGMELCHQAGVAVATNSCLSRDDFYNGNLEKVLDKAKELKATIVQIIHPKPAGAWLKSGAELFSAEDLEHIRKKVDKYNLDDEYKDYPLISAQILEEAPDRFGCTAGGTDRFYINAKGDVQPCEFLNISFGNIYERPFAEIYKEMREVFHTPGVDWPCEKYAKDILEIYEKHNLKSLPLPLELSREFCKKLDLGMKTPAYKKIDELK
ncbi:MAG: radical SAM protein [Oligoflexia bacterium]|nr:radical SAM protein [Oligoflexia bacterium]